MTIAPTNGTKIFLISAIASGQGKTTVTAALSRLLIRQGVRVRVFKTGPDFLDPMLLARACGTPVMSLDAWMIGIEECRNALAHAALDADVVLIEAMMGLYDGSPSSADLATVLGVPVIAVIDASAMAQTTGALVYGLRHYGAVNLVGVIANRVDSAGHANMIAASLQEVPLLARLPTQSQSLPERQLGIILPTEIHDVDILLDTLADALVLHDEKWRNLPATQLSPVSPPISVEASLAGKKIAVARDAAFAFIYPANLECLSRLGASLSFFSPLDNMAVPDDADAIYLPGGYPELHGATLSNANRWQVSIRRAHRSGVPIWAECGGMMSVADMLMDIEGRTWPMAGLLAGRVRMQSRLAGIGSQALMTSHGELRGHCFHYSRFESDIDPDGYTTNQANPALGEAIYRSGSLTATYFHAYFPSNPAAAATLFTRRVSA